MSAEQNKISALAQMFVEAWDGLMGEYPVHLSCDEVDTAAELFRVFGKGVTADYLVRCHEEMERTEKEECRHLS